MDKPRRRRLSALTAALVLVAGGSLTLIAGAGGASAPPRVVGTDGLAVYDSRGKLVGAVFDLQGTQPTVALKVGGGIATFTVDPNLLAATGNTHGAQLLYESADCTGQPFAPFGPGALTGAGGILGAPLVLNGTKLYEPSGEERELIVNSALNQEGVFCEQITFSHTDVPLQEVVDLATVFRPPFSVRAR